MTQVDRQLLSDQEQCAVEELRNLIQQHYPAAKFEIQRGHDDPAAVHLVAMVDVSDTDAILDLVMDRMMEIQIEREIPLFVIPVRPPVRARRRSITNETAVSVP